MFGCDLMCVVSLFVREWACAAVATVPAVEARVGAAAAPMLALALAAAAVAAFTQGRRV